MLFLVLPKKRIAKLKQYVLEMETVLKGQYLELVFNKILSTYLILEFKVFLGFSLQNFF